MSDFSTPARPLSRASIPRRFPSRRRRLRDHQHSIASQLVLILTATMISGCGYPKVSPVTYEYAKALYSISNRKASEQLDNVKSQIAESVQQGEITGRESEWLMGIIDDAHAGDWEKAGGKARQMMEDQIRKVK